MNYKRFYEKEMAQRKAARKRSKIRKLKKKYRAIEKAVRGKKSKKIKEVKEKIEVIKKRNILDRIEDKIPSTFFKK